MDLSRLADKQKRLADWSRYCEQILDNQLRERTKSTLERYRAVLVQCWKNDKVSDSDALSIRDLERQLENLNELARMTVTAVSHSGSLPKRF